MNLTWDVGAFVVGTGGLLLWLIKLIIAQELSKFEVRLGVSETQMRDLERRVNYLETHD